MNKYCSLRNRLQTKEKIKDMRFSFFLILALLFCNPALSRQNGTEISENTTEGYKWYPKFVTFLPAGKMDSVLVYADTDIIPVIYPVNRYDIKANQDLDSIISVINRIRLDSRVNLSHVWVGGSASPEGPEKWNRILGEKRAKALADYLLENTGLPEEKFRIENLGEDWYSLSNALKKSNLYYRDTVLEIIATEPDYVKRKHRIQAIENNRVWTSMIRDIFPIFRNARMVIVCAAEPDVPSAIKAVEMQKPEYRPVYPATVSLAERTNICAKTPETRFFALKTNAFFLGGLIANLSFETELWRHWSIDFPVYYSPYNLFKETRKLRLLAIQPEMRYWLGKAGEGHFFGLHGHVAGFNIAINDNGRYQDPNRVLWGLGIGYGYTFNFGKEKRWGLELNIGAGFADYKYDAYRNWENGPKYDSGSGCYWGITRAGISIFYKWYYKNRKHE